MKKVFLLASVIWATSIFAADGATLYKTCATCHGAKGEKAALNKMTMNHTITPMENPMQIRAARKTIARMMTEIRKRELTEKK